LKIPLPGIITTDLRLNEPRYASLPNIMKAKKKQLDVMEPSDLAVSYEPRLQIISVAEPPPRTGGGKVADVDELIDKLKNEAKVI
jgi:electron transfer flavoprotein beta subunit